MSDGFNDRRTAGQHDTPRDVPRETNDEGPPPPRAPALPRTPTPDWQLFYQFAFIMILLGALAMIIAIGIWSSLLLTYAGVRRANAPPPPPRPAPPPNAEPAASPGGVGGFMLIIAPLGSPQTPTCPTIGNPSPSHPPLTPPPPPPQSTSTENVDRRANGQSSNKKAAIRTVIAIDLGTTKSSVGAFKDGKVEIIANDQGNRVTPSYVAFTGEGERLIGDAAKNELPTNPENTVYHTKRIIGRDWGDTTVQDDVKRFSYRLVEKNQKPHINVQTSQGQKTFAPEEISAMVLVKMKETAEFFLGKKVTDAVVTVPAYFNNAQRQATKDAGVIAGLNVMLISDPTAAAIAYGLDKIEGKKTILVMDMGSGTFDISILTIDNGVFHVVATNGDTHLGGEDFTQRIMDYLINIYQKKKGREIQNDKRALGKLHRAVEKAKLDLTSSLQTRIRIESFIDGDNFTQILTRAKLEEINAPLFRSTMKSVQKVLDDSDTKKHQVHQILLVGGSSRIPKIEELLKAFFDGKEPLRANIEAVIYGATVQAGVLSGERGTGDLAVFEVNPLTMGIETVGGVMTKLIPRNTKIPTTKKKVFTTTSDSLYVGKISISVWEGERTIAKNNRLVGKFDLTGIPPAPRGIPQVEVTFKIDANGILQVTAKDIGTGINQRINVIKYHKSLTEDQIENMIKESKEFAENDNTIRKANYIRQIGTENGEQDDQEAL